MNRALEGKSVALIGAGNMGLAMLEGWAAEGLVGDGVAVIDPNPSERLQAVCAAKGYSLDAGAGGARDAVILATKPQMLEAGTSAAAPFVGPESVVVSILAGKRIADIGARLPTAQAIVRAMPNTPAAIGRGVTGAFASPVTSQGQRALAHALLAAAGQVEWVESEALIDAVTAVSGSGPAYVFYLVECLAAAGVEAGLPADLAGRLARATIEGAGELLHRQADVSAETLRQRVTSPGGTTAAALSVLMAEDGLAPLMSRAVAAAKKRAGELSG
ncbi:pyrroline-5-carboxylate reductase [Methylocystis sp. MJC1]|uniref:pyrroline-5-carboxylate reductase n=1 Tax=Methylocystis sp. MJC1 TaxID=2654282 RepID=UPI0013EBC560|nr:pyrroline-5-carboxylate reductase [Methylocystis sp. MJC1]KAF2992168.1 Pyrroline-5-carboxylate reductase [Methylocystis sp. MJC1]MBU6527308.1 pyrroline-5-carboxylate reductase [Methylocystis sp. MJC1]UZX10259.1 pyrroline-5-carboxylate reductase [Methylocystis sp. MJC1]